MTRPPQPYAPFLSTAVTLGAGALFVFITLARLDTSQKALEEKMVANQKALEEKMVANQKATEEKMAANQKATEEKMAANQKATEEKMAADFKEELKPLLAAVMDLNKTLSCIPRALASVAGGLHEAAGGRPLRALAAASHAEVEDWLTQIGFEQYVPVLAPLGGALLLLQTEASLLAAGVKPHHVAQLLDRINAAAYAPPPPEPDAR